MNIRICRETRASVAALVIGLLNACAAPLGSGAPESPGVGRSAQGLSKTADLLATRVAHFTRKAAALGNEGVAKLFGFENSLRQTATSEGTPKADYLVSASVLKRDVEPEQVGFGVSVLRADDPAARAPARVAVTDALQRGYLGAPLFEDLFVATDHHAALATALSHARDAGLSRKVVDIHLLVTDASLSRDAVPARDALTEAELRTPNVFATFRATVDWTDANTATVTPESALRIERKSIVDSAQKVDPAAAANEEATKLRNRIRAARQGLATAPTVEVDVDGAPQTVTKAEVEGWDRDLNKLLEQVKEARTVLRVDAIPVELAQLVDGPFTVHVP